MIRKQLYITPETDRALKIEARKQGSTQAEIIRKILAKELKVKQKKEAQGTLLLDLTTLGGKNTNGPKDLSANMFDYLYGNKSPRYGKNKPKLTRAEEKHIQRFINENSQ